MLLISSGTQRDASYQPVRTAADGFRLATPKLQVVITNPLTDQKHVFPRASYIPVASAAWKRVLGGEDFGWGS